MSPTHQPILHTFLYQFNYFKYFYEAHIWNSFSNDYLCANDTQGHYDQIPYVLFAQISVNSNEWLDALVIMVGIVYAHLTRCR